ncbi:MAG: hypothetical protein ACXVB9_18010 [Bdellovibrionota bacterium]
MRVFVVLLFLTSCSTFGVPGDYHSWLTKDLELSPIRHFAMIDLGGGTTDLEPVFLLKNGEEMEELVFPEFVWGYSYELRTRGRTVVHPWGTTDVPHSQETREVEKVLSVTPVAKGSCFTTYLTPYEPLTRASLIALLAPNTVELNEAAEIALGNMHPGTTYNLELCFPYVPDMKVSLRTITEKQSP